MTTPQATNTSPRVRWVWKRPEGSARMEPRGGVLNIPLAADAPGQPRQPDSTNDATILRRNGFPPIVVVWDRANAQAVNTGVGVLGHLMANADRYPDLASLITGSFDAAGQ